MQKDIYTYVHVHLFTNTRHSSQISSIFCTNPPCPVGFMLFTTSVITSWAKIFVPVHLLYGQKFSGVRAPGGPGVHSCVLQDFQENCHSCNFEQVKIGHRGTKGGSRLPPYW